jgi:hypothetical protein
MLTALVVFFFLGRGEVSDAEENAEVRSATL